MTWTYDERDVTTTLAKIRREISDTVKADPLLSDEEIAYAYTEEGSVLAAASRCAEWLARKFSRDFDYEADGTKVQKIKRAQMYRELAAELRARTAVLSSGTGSISVVGTRNVDGWQRGVTPPYSSTDLLGRTDA